MWECPSGLTPKLRDATIPDAPPERGNQGDGSDAGMTFASEFLFARPSFWREFGRLLDIGGVMTEFNYSLTPNQADYFAMRADWHAVGDELRAAMASLGHEVGEKFQQVS